MKLILKFLLTTAFLISTNQAFSKDPDCELIDFKTTCTIENNKLTTEYSYLIQINNKSGDKYAKISLTYSKANKISNLKAWIEDLSGNKIRELKRGDIVDKSAISGGTFYNDLFNKEFELKHNAYPYRIKYSYTENYNEFPVIENWFPMFDTDVPVREAQLDIYVPRDYGIKVYERKINRADSSFENNQVHYQWKVRNIEAIDAEYYHPSYEDLVPRVVVIPESFTWFTKGSTENWQSFGNWVYDLTSGLDQLPEAEKQKINKLLNGITDETEKIKILYHYLQDNTRYIDVSIKYGGLRPYPADYVATNKFGDCKALSNYMVALLKYAGIGAYHTLIEADDNPAEFIKGIPLQQFNHMIVTVPLKTDSIFLECTNSTLPFGYVGEYTQNRYALLVEKDSSRLVRTPMLTENKTTDYKKLVFNVEPNGECKVDIHNICRGPKFEYFNSLRSNSSKHDQEEFLREQVINFPNFEMENWMLRKPNRDSARIDLNVTLQVHNFLASYGQDKAFPLLQLYLPSFETPQKRKLPLKINYPIHKYDSLIYELPKGVIARAPENALIESEFGFYKRTANSIENKLIIYREFLLKPGEYDLSQYQEFYSFIKSITQTDRIKILLPK